MKYVSISVSVDFTSFGHDRACIIHPIVSVFNFYDLMENYVSLFFQFELL